MGIQSVGSFGASTPQAASPQGSPPAATGSDAANKALQATPQQTEPSREQVQQAVEEMKKRSMESPTSSKLQFSIDDTTGRTVVRVTDGATGETIRQIPSEEILAIARALDRMQGLLLRQQA